MMLPWYSRSEMRLTSLLISIVFALVSSGSVDAQYANPAPQSAQVSAAEILQALLPPQAKDRGIKRPSAAVNLATENPKSTILVDFEEDTELLSVSGMKILRELSIALQDQRLRGSSFQIAVHGYSAGDPQLQVRTSRRAQVIAEHLASFYQIEIDRLQAIGVGAQFVANVNNPNDPMNFRVEIFNIPQI